jgi:putative membrane protein
MSDEETAAMHTTTGVRAWLTVYLKGLAMGAADSVPGVSGGTIALITGIYERLIDALTAFDPRILGQVPDLDSADGRHRFWTDLRRMDVFFLVVLGLGVATSIVTISRIVHTALEMARPQTFAFFFGLIAASAVVLYDQLSLQTPLEIGSAAAGFVIAFLVTGISNGAGLGHALPLLFVAGAIAISAMVLPGISGAFLLILLGQYEYLTGVLSALVDGLLAFGAEDLVSNLVVVVTFGCGAVIGLFTVAHAVRRALDEYRSATIAFLVSLMVGSLRLPLVEVVGGVEMTAVPAVTTALGAVLAGAVAVLLLDYYTEDLSTVAA